MSARLRLTAHGLLALGLLIVTALAISACGVAGRSSRHHALAAARVSWGASDSIPLGTPPVDAIYGPPSSALSTDDAAGEIPAGQYFTKSWFAASSPWNTIVSNLPADPRSSQLLRAAQDRVGVVEQPGGLPPKTDTIFTNAGLYINTVAWTDPVVQGGPETPIHCRQTECGDDHGITELPIPADASPDPYYDGWFTVISPSGDTAYDMWRARRLPNGAISFQYMRIWNLRGTGYGAPSQPSARGSGLPLFAGLIRPAELAAGQIDHALAISVPAPASRYYVQPASTTDGNGATDSLPEGARIRLNADVRLNPSLRLTTSQRRYASALMWTLRNYGAIVVGRSAVPTLYGQQGVTASQLAGNELQSLHLDDFQVVQMPRELQYPTPDNKHSGVAATVASIGGGANDTSTLNAGDGAALESRPPSDLVIDGSTGGSLTDGAVRQYRADGGVESVAVRTKDVQHAFAALCTGQADVVDSSDAITSAEQAQCARHGIRPVQLQVASDAVVLATENETDVGADCLTVAQLHTIYRAGSPVTNWSQLGFDTVPLEAAGPNPEANALGSFGAALTGTANPSLVDFRYDYNSEPSEDAIRRFVVGSTAQGELASAELPQLDNTVTSLQLLLSGERATYRGAASYVSEAAHQVRKGIADKRPASAQAQDSANLAAADAKLAAARAAIHELQQELASARALVRANQAVQNAGERQLGHLGAFEYSYYTLYEQQLRPLEISSLADPEDCVFPSQDTITSGLYPLSRQLLLTFSLQELRANSGLRTFLESYLNSATQLASAAAMVPLPSDLLAAEEQWLSGDAAPTSSGGSVSLAGGGAALNSMTTAAGGGGANASAAGLGVPEGVH